MMKSKSIPRGDRAWRLVLCVAASSLSLLVGLFTISVTHAQSPRIVADGVYTATQAEAGQALYLEQCAACHGGSLGGGQGPPLAGETFVDGWRGVPLSDLVSKVRATMPENAPGELTGAEATSLIAYVIQANGFPAGAAELSDEATELSQIGWSAAPADQTAETLGPPGNLAELMRGILFPSSNLLFNVQTNDPGAARTAFDATDNFSWVEWGAGIYSGWQIVDYAAIALAESAPLFLTPGRLCENGQPVPVDRADWIQYTAEMVEAGKAAYRASQTRDQETVSEVTNVIAEACYNCHEAYRDKPGGTQQDPSNKAARCVP
jgi:mono/diheme cytochrome c family protein